MGCRVFFARRVLERFEKVSRLFFQPFSITFAKVATLSMFKARCCHRPRRCRHLLCRNDGGDHDDDDDDNDD